MTNFKTNGFAPEYWGPGMWRVIHMAAATYPVNPTHQEQQDFYNFFTTLKRVLPCGGCRAEYEKMTTKGPLKLKPEILKTRTTLFAWTVAIHNAVNQRLGKPINPDVSFWYKYYDRLRPQ